MDVELGQRVNIARDRADVDARTASVEHLTQAARPGPPEFVVHEVLFSVEQQHRDGSIDERAEEVNEPQLLFPCYDGLATLYLDAGRPQQAEAWLAKAQALCERAGLEPDALMVLPFLC